MFLHNLVVFAIASAALFREKPLPAAFSPDHEILATTKVPQDFVTPEGGNYSVLLNGNVVYPIRHHHRFADFYAGWHTLLTDFRWSPDSQQVAFVEKVYDWQYSEPYNMYFDGRVSNEHFYLALVSRDGKTTGYLLAQVPDELDLRWQGPDKLVLNDRTYDLRSNPPKLIP